MNRGQYHRVGAERPPAGARADEITESELYRERQMSLTPRERWRITFAEWVRVAQGLPTT